LQTEESTEAGTQPANQQKWYLPWLAPLAGTLIFLPTLWYGFIWDDRYSIVENTSLQSWKTLARFVRGPLNPMTDMYRPVTGFVLFFQYHLFRLHPWGYHLTSVVLHGIACALLYRLALQLSGKKSIAVFASFLFAVHAAHLEAVAWVSALAEPLVVSTILAGLLFYLRYRQERQTKWLAAICVSLLVGLLTKETAIVLPLLLLAYELNCGDLTLHNLRRNSPLVAVLTCTVLVYVTMRHFAFTGFIYNESKLPFSVLLLTWPSLLLTYWHHLLVPTMLSPFYDSRYVTSANGDFWLPLLALIAIVVAAYFGAKRFANGRLIRFCMWAMSISIIPALDLNIFQFQEILHDRFLYLPSVFFSILVGQLLFGVHGRENSSRSASGDTPVAAIYVVLGVCMALLNVAALLIQSPVWKSDTALMSYAVRIAPGNARPAFTLAALELQQGNLPQAEQMLQHVVQLVPAPRALLLLGETRLRMGNAGLAEQPLRQAIATAPDRSGQHLALGECLQELGRTDEAKTEFKNELSVGSEYREVVLQKLSQLDKP
jgi:hypothetical protein